MLGKCYEMLQDLDQANKEYQLASDLEPNNNDLIELKRKRETQELDKEFIDTTLGLEKKINPFM